MKKLCSILLVFVFICANILGTFAAEVGTVEITNAGLVTYNTNFKKILEEIPDAGKSSGFTTSNLLPNVYVSTGKNTNYSAAGAKFRLRGNDGYYLNMYTGTDSTSQDFARYPSMRFYLNGYSTDRNVSVNALADAEKYTVRFQMKYQPFSTGTESRTYIYLNSRLSLLPSSTSTTGYYVKCEEKSASASSATTVNANEGAVTTGLSANTWYTYEITVDKINKKSTIKMNTDGQLKTIFEDAGYYTAPNDNIDDTMFIKGENASYKGDIKIRDVSVIVSESAAYKGTGDEWKTKTNINFDDITVGRIPNTTAKENNIGGFECNPSHALVQESSKVFVDYTYDDTNPSVINKLLRINKTATGGPLNVKRDISKAVEGYSDYEISMDINNQLSDNGSTCFIRVGDGSSSVDGTVLSFAISGTVQIRDYNKAAFDPVDGITMDKNTWKTVKVKVYRDLGKADWYIDNQLIYSNAKTNHKCGGDYIAVAPQSSAKGTVLVKNITITPITKSDYTLTYDSGSVYKNEYDGNSVTANCEVAEGKAEPIVLIARYSADGKLLDIAKSGEITERTVTATLSGIETAVNDKISIMVWNSMNGLVPVKQAISLSKKTE